MKKIFHKAGEGSGLFVETEKTLTQVKKDHGAGTWQSLTIDEAIEGYTLDPNGKLVAYNLETEQQKIIAEREAVKEAEVAPLREALKTKLGLTDVDLADLKKVLQ